MFYHLTGYQLSGWQLLLLLLGFILAFCAGQLLRKERRLKKALTLFFAVAVFVLDYLCYPGWTWVHRAHPAWRFFESWCDLFSFFEFIFLPFDAGLLMSWIRLPGAVRKKCKE